MDKVIPEIGMGVTYCIGSDRYPYTIKEISTSKKRLYLTSDDVKIVSGSGHDGSAVYEYSTVYDKESEIITLRRDGVWRKEGDTKGGGMFVIGTRRYYQDPHF